MPYPQDQAIQKAPHSQHSNVSSNKLSNPTTVQNREAKAETKYQNNGKPRHADLYREQVD